MEVLKCSPNEYIKNYPTKLPQKIRKTESFKENDDKKFKMMKFVSSYRSFQ